jgi:hypothetical protein
MYLALTPIPSAATLMCEYAQRLAQESHTMNAGTLQEQANCYLAAISTFRLIDPRNAWAVRASHVRPHKIVRLCLLCSLSAQPFDSIFPPPTGKP